MMKEKKYQSAVRVLRGGTPGPKALLMLGECHYLLGEYGDSRSYFSRAFTKLEDPGYRRICEHRLAMLAYRLGDFRGATERIDNLLRKYPEDKRAGTLLAVRMKIVAAGGQSVAEKIAELEPLRDKLREDRRRYGYYNFVLGSNTLANLYAQAGEDEKANAVLVEAAHEMGGVISRHKAEKRPLSEDLLRGYDSMSLQIARHYLARKDYGEVDKWLGNVGSVPELTRQAKLLRAQVAMSRRDPDRVRATLSDEFLATVPAGGPKSAMYLVLGLAERARKETGKAKEYLKLVAPGDKGYTQAQHALGDIYREAEDPAMARKHYEISVKDKAYESAALFHLANIDLAMAGIVDLTRREGGAEVKALHQSAATRLNRLVTNYPLTNYARDARPLLAKLGIEDARPVASKEETGKAADWERVVKEQPGTNAAAQALVSLAEFHRRELYDPSGTTVVKAPNWRKVAGCANRLLESGDRPFAGVSPERWNELRTTMHFLRGKAELASLPRGGHYRAPKGRQPVFLEGGGDAERAIADFEKARKLGKAAGRDLQEEWEMSLLEAMFKSGDEARRAEAEQRYAELESEYGSSPRYQLLALNLADWFVERGEYVLAARSYRNVSGKSDLDRDKAVQLLYLAGSYFSRAARKVAEIAHGGRRTCGIFIYPKEVLEAPEFIETYRPFRQTMRLNWDPGKNPRAGEVLETVSKEFGIPFVWSPEKYKGSVAEHLERRRIPAARLAEFTIARSPAEYLRLIFGGTGFRFDHDLGLSGGRPTFTPDPAAFEFDPRAAERARVIEIHDPNRERLRALAKEYPWDEHFRDQSARSVMMFHIVKRIEELTGARVFYADSVARDDLLAREFETPPAGPDDARGGEVTCGEVLRRTLAPVGLTFRLTARDRSAELFEEAKECFNEVRKFGRETEYTERALFTLATNFSFRKDWEKMRLVLREYLKVFDHAGFPNYHAANFWLGWAFENQRKYREAARYYTRAAEETVLVFKSAPGEELAPAGEVRARLGYDTLYHLSLPAEGAFEEAPLTGRFSDFIRFNTNIALKFDPAVQAMDATVSRARFKRLSCFDLLYGVMAEHGLDLRSENADPDIAERAYYRLAAVQKQQNALHDALDSITLLLERFPGTERKVDALKMRLDIYKGLKDYGRVLDAIAELRAASEGTVGAYKFDYELGRVWFDMCDFGKAVEAYAMALSGARARRERLAIREAYAQALSRVDGAEAEAQTQFEALLKEETGPLRSSIARLMVRYLRFRQGETKVKPLAPEEEKFIALYEATPDDEFDTLSRNEYACATWIYYLTGLRDAAESRHAAALTKFEAAGKSPDDYLAGEALLQAGLLHLRAGDVEAARATFQHLLFATRSVPAAVRATYYLAECHKKEGDEDDARRRFAELVRKFPISPYARRALEDPLMRDTE